MCFNVLTVMSYTGDIYIGALGTVPNLFTPPRSEARPINYEESDAEMAQLNTLIKNIQSQEPQQIMAQGGDELSINIEVSPHIEECYHQTLVSDEDAEGGAGQGIPMAKVSIELSASTPLTRIRVGIDAAEPLVVTRTSFIVNSLSK